MRPKLVQIESDEKMSDDTEDFIGGLIDSSPTPTSQLKQEYKDESSPSNTIGGSGPQPKPSKSNSKKWMKPLFLCIGLVGVGILTILSSNTKQPSSPPQQAQIEQGQAKAPESQAAASTPVVDVSGTASSSPENQETTMLGGSGTQQPAAASTSSQSAESTVVQENTSTPVRGDTVKPLNGNAGASVTIVSALKEKDEIIADMKASIQSKDRDIEGLMREIEILKQQKRVAKVAVKVSEPKIAATPEMRKQVNTSNKLVMSPPKSKSESRKEGAEQAEYVGSAIERNEESRKISAPEALRVIGVTMREGMEMAIVDISGEKKRIFVGDQIPGLGRVSEITRAPSIVINGVTYK